MRTLATVTPLVVFALALAPAAGAPQATFAGDDEPGVPLLDVMASMEPQAAWQSFYDLTQLPQASHHEEQATPGREPKPWRAR